MATFFPPCWLHHCLALTGMNGDYLPDHFGKGSVPLYVDAAVRVFGIFKPGILHIAGKCPAILLGEPEEAPHRLVTKPEQVADYLILVDLDGVAGRRMVANQVIGASVCLG